MLDTELAEIYGVTTKALIQAVKKNIERFPADFAFQLNAPGSAWLKLQVPRIYPWVFTDRGALMVAFVLRSKQAAEMSVHIVRASVRLREMVAADQGLAKLLDELERRVSHRDEAVTSILKAIRELATHSDSLRRTSTVSVIPAISGQGIRSLHAHKDQV
jgi:hypothetical protein